MTTQICTKCSKAKDIEEFGLRADGTKRKTWCHQCNRENRAAYVVANRERVNQQQRDHRKKTNSASEKQYYQNNKEAHCIRVRRARLLREYGITLETYNAMFEAQQGCCAICKKPETKKSRGGDKVDWLVVDHCHKTEKVRALLCCRHNVALGHFNDDPDTIRAAADYVEQHAEAGS